MNETYSKNALKMTSADLGTQYTLNLLNKFNLTFNEIKKLGNVKFAMSNSNVELVRDNFKAYHCENIVARRAIHSKNPGATSKEVIIYN